MPARVSAASQGMSLTLLAAAALAVEPTQRIIQARATIRIISHVKVTEASWKTAARRRDRVLRDESGRLIRLRTIDFE